MSSLFNFSYFSEELIKDNNLCCFTIIIDIIVSPKNQFFSLVHKTLVIENILSTDTLVPGIAIEYSKMIVKYLMKILLFSNV